MYRLTLLLILAITACENDSEESDSTKQGSFTDCQVQDCASEVYLRNLADESTFDLLATRTNKLGVSGASLKFFIDRRQEENKIYYINGNYTSEGEIPKYVTLHFDFARKVLAIPETAADYNQVTYFENDKQYVAGTIQKYTLDGRTVFGVQFYPQDVISGDAIVGAVRTVFESTGFGVDNLGFVATGEQQVIGDAEADLAEYGSAWQLEDFLGSQNFFSLHSGEAYGYLQVFPANQDYLKPTDIAVFKDLPLDLSVVSGVITQAYQESNSHVNLKSKERNTPNMVLRNIDEDIERFRSLNGKPVLFKVTEASYEITESSDAAVASFHKKRMDKPVVKLAAGNTDEIVSLDKLCVMSPDDCIALSPQYGGKAAGLGFLAHPFVLGRADDSGSYSAGFGYDLSPKGLAVPINWYNKIVGDPANRKLNDAIAMFITKENSGELSPRDKHNLSLAVQDLFLQAKLPEGLLEQLYTQFGTTLPGIRAVKIRSSANAEDIAGFNGAGLYNSYRATTKQATDGSCAIRIKYNKWGALRQKVYPATVACAVKAVYASLWNKRAVEERTFARIDHESAAMGLAIVPVYDHDSKIKANSVVVTDLIDVDTLNGYSVATQAENNLVTNPAPPTYSEESIALFNTNQAPNSYTVRRYAKPYLDQPQRTSMVLERQEADVMIEVSRRIETQYCEFIPEYFLSAASGVRGCDDLFYYDGKPVALDIEFKLLENGQFVAKQVRQFGK